MSAIDEFLILFRTQVQDGGLNRLNSRIKSTRNELFSMKNLLKGFIGYDIYSAVRSFIPQMIDTSRQLGAIHARLFAVTGSSQLAGTEFNWLTKQCKDLGLELMQTADQYSLFYSNASNRLGVEKTRTVFKQMLELQRVMHLSPERFKSALLAYNTIASTGVLQLTRITRQLNTSLPDVMRKSAKAMGFGDSKEGVTAFMKAVSAKQIDATQYLIKFTKAEHDAYVTQESLREAMLQTDAQIQKLQYSWQMFMIGLAKAGFIEDLGKVLNFVNKCLDKLDGHTQAVWNTLKLIAGLGIVAFLGSMAFNIVKTTRTVIGLINAIKSLRTLMLLTALQGGAEAAGVASGASGLFLFLTQPELWIPIAIAAIVAVLAFGAKLILDKYFPDIWRNIFLMMTRMHQMLLEMIWDAADAWNKSPLGKVWHVKTQEERDNDTGFNSTVDKYIDKSNMAKMMDSFLTVMPSMSLLKPILVPAADRMSGAISNIYQPKTIIQSLVVQTTADNAGDIAEEIKKKLDERDQKHYKTWGEAVAASKANSQNPLGLLQY